METEPCTGLLRVLMICGCTMSSSIPLEVGLQLSRPKVLKTVYFFKIIIPSILKEKQLGLPCKFVQENGHILSDIATLEVRNGDVWRVQLRKAGGKFWFSKGWEDFVEHYSLSTGHLLNFQYSGSSKFYVVICDMSAVEIDYPKNSKRQKLCTPESSAMPSWQAYKTSNPSFVVEMKQSCVHILKLPLGFIKKHFRTVPVGDIRLCVHDGASYTRVWRVNCGVYDGVVKLLQWDKFYTDNAIKEHDVCVFELTSTESVTFKVSIFQSKKEAASSETTQMLGKIVKDENKTVIDID